MATVARFRPQTMLQAARHLPPACNAWAPPLLLVILPFLLFRQGLGTGTPPFGGDVLVLDYPLLTLVKRQIGQGLLPLWNNYAGGGYPLVPFSALIFYPPLWPLRLLSVDDAITLLDVTHFALAGLGLYLLAGVTGAGRAARTIGALSFVLSGFMIGHLYAGHLFELGVVAWMPWVFLAAHRLLARPSLHAALLLGLAGGLQMLANGIGFLVFTGYPVAALLALGLVARLRREGFPAVRLLVLPLAGGLLALGLAAVIFLPFTQVLGWSIRAGGLDYAGASQISLPPAALLMALYPDAVGNGALGSYWLSAYADGYWHEFALYIGLLPLLAALVACLRCRRQPHVPFYAILVLAGLLMALGRYTPVYWLAFHLLPGLDLVRVPARWLLLATLGAAVLAAAGVEWLLAQRAGALALLRALRLPLLAAPALALPLLAGLQIAYLQTGAMGLEPHLALTLHLASSRLLIFGGLLALVLACHADRLIRPQATAGLLLATTLLDLWVAQTHSISFVSPESYYAPSTVSALLHADAGTYRVLTIDRSMPNRQGMVSGTLYDAEDFAPVTLQAYWQVTHPPECLNGKAVSNAGARDLITCYDPRFGNLMSIGAVTTAAPIDTRLAQFRGLELRTAVATESWLLPNGRDWNPSRLWRVTYVYRNARALPRAFLLPATQARTLTPPLAQLRAVLASGFDGRRDLLLDPQPAGVPLGMDLLQDLWTHLLQAAPAAPPTSLAPGAARVIADNGNSVQVAVNARSDAYLVLDDAYYPGWQVRVDGRAAPMLRADYLLRAVRVSPGRHVLVFTYAPLSYLVGMAVTGAAGLLATVYLLWPLARTLRRRTYAPAPSTAATSPSAAAPAEAEPLVTAGSASS